jgi:hypothetical protein
MLNLNILIDEDLHREFKVAVIRKGTTMTAVLVEYIQEYLKNESIQNNTVCER